MPKPSIENLTVWSKQVTSAQGVTPVVANWEVSFTAITSKGARYEERKAYPGMTRAQLWDAVRKVATDYDAAEASPPAGPVKEFPDRYDATAGTMTTLAPADYPVGEAPKVV